MKNTIKFLFLALFLLNVNARAATTHALPECTDQTQDSVACYASKSAADKETANMLIDNRAVQNLKHFSNHYSRGFELSEVAVTHYPVAQDITDKHISVYHTRYEIFLDDSRGVDISGPRFIWSVDEMCKTDGYNGSCTYQNSMAKLGKVPDGVVFGNGNTDDETAIIESVRKFLEPAVQF
jgi:hypothetical protein